MTDQEIEIEERIQAFRLSKEEAVAYRYFCQTNAPPLSPDLQEKLFRVYLNGSSCEQIFRLNGKKYSLGAIVSARIEGNWDELIKKNASELISNTMEKVTSARIESVNLLSTLITASIQAESEKVLRYMQSQDPDDLGVFRIEGVKGLKDALDTLDRLLSNGSKGGGSAATNVLVQGVERISIEESKPAPPDEGVSSILKRLKEAK